MNKSQKNVPDKSLSGWHLQTVQMHKLNEKRDNKQCLLETPRRVTVNCKKSEKKMHIYKFIAMALMIIKNYKEKLL